MPLQIDVPAAQAPLLGELVNQAEAEVTSDERLSVRFGGGELKPVEGCDMEAWRATFEAVDFKKRSLKQRVTGWVSRDSSASRGGRVTAACPPRTRRVTAV